MKNLASLILLILITSPSYACACGGGSPTETLALLAVFIIGAFLFFAMIGISRDRDHIFRYASLITFPSILIPFCFVILFILTEPNISGEFFFGIIFSSFIGSVWLAESKAKSSREQKIKEKQN